MINCLIPPTDIHQLSRSASPEKKYTTFSDFDEVRLLGTGGQNPINTGSSMFNATSDPQMEPNITALVQQIFNGDNYITKYVANEAQLALIASHNLILFKNNLEIRKIILNSIYNRETRSFNQHIYGGYLFIFISLHFMFTKSFYNKNNVNDIRVLTRYFTDSDDFNTKLIDALYNAPVIENLTAFCTGRFFFVDDKLSDYNDFKTFPLRTAQILIENS